MAIVRRALNLETGELTYETVLNQLRPGDMLPGTPKVICRMYGGVPQFNPDEKCWVQATLDPSTAGTKYHIPEEYWPQAFAAHVYKKLIAH